MLNTLKILSLKDIAIYDYKTLSYTNNNTLNYLLNNDYDYIITIDYCNKQLDIDLYKKNSHNILFNINIDLYYNKDAFKTLNDFILNNNKDYKIIKINKAFLNIE